MAHYTDNIPPLEIPSGFIHRIREFIRNIKTYYWTRRWNHKGKIGQMKTSTLDFLNED